MQVRDYINKANLHMFQNQPKNFDKNKKRKKTKNNKNNNFFKAKITIKLIFLHQKYQMYII